MSWKTHLAKIAVEFGEDIAGRVGRILGEDASENEARDTARRIQRTLTPEAARPAVRPRPSVAKPKARQTPRRAPAGVVADDAGRPLRVFHGSDRKFERPDPSRAKAGLGVYVTPNKDFAQSFVRDPEGGVLEGYLRAPKLTDLSAYGPFPAETDLGGIASGLGVDEDVVRNAYQNLAKQQGDVHMFSLLENSGRQLGDDEAIRFMDWGDGAGEPAFVFGNGDNFLADLPAEVPAAPARISSRSGSPLAVAQDVLHAAANKRGRASFADWRKANPENGVILDHSKLSAVPDVAQHDLPRYEPPRGPSARIVDALADPAVADGINATVERGMAGGGLDWYNTEPVLERLRAGSNDAASAYKRLMDVVAATSPRSKVTDNIRTGSYYNYLLSNGLPIPEKPAAGYGSVAQNLHRDNVRGILERGGWDVFQNPKPASFSANLQGNQMPATIDTHNFRLPGILSGDPRFLETTVSEQADDVASGLETLRRQYPMLPDDVVAAAVGDAGAKGARINYRPREWVDKGYISPDDAVSDPGLWSTKPEDNEYGYYERWQQDQAKKYGISPAQYQASMWLGGGDTTGLGSAAEPFVSTLEARVRYTADILGMDPDKLMDLYIHGKVPLLAEGGSVDVDELSKRYGC